MNVSSLFFECFKELDLALEEAALIQVLFLGFVDLLNHLTSLLCLFLSILKLFANPVEVDGAFDCFELLLPLNVLFHFGLDW